MRRLVLALVVLFVIGFVGSASAQDKVDMYPYSVFNKKPLPVGATVWINHGETKCTYGKWSLAGEADGLAYPLPSASDECFKEYRKAKIVKVLRVNGRYVYRVNFEPWIDRTDGFRFEWNGEFDRLYEIYNLPERWSYSKYFLALSW